MDHDRTKGTEEAEAGGIGDVQAAPIMVPLTYTPRKRADVLELDMEDGLILYNRDSSLVHHLNPSAGIVWQLCDGSATVEQLARDIAEEYGQPPEAVTEQVAVLVAELDAMGLIENA